MYLLISQGILKCLRLRSKSLMRRLKTVRDLPELKYRRIQRLFWEIGALWAVIILKRFIYTEIYPSGATSVLWTVRDLKRLLSEAVVKVLCRESEQERSKTVLGLKAQAP